MMTFREFDSFIATSFDCLDSQMRERFSRMEEIYKEWNSRINVISRKDIDSIYDHHVLHSLSIAKYLESRRPQTYSRLTSEGGRIMDLGTGGGFPGIPLAILFPRAGFTLCDSVGKKTLVAARAAEALGLTNLKVVNERAEKIPSLETMARLACALNTSLDYLVCGMRPRCDRENCHLYTDMEHLLKAFGFDKPTS